MQWRARMIAARVCMYDCLHREMEEEAECLHREKEHMCRTVYIVCTDMRVR